MNRITLILIVALSCVAAGCPSGGAGSKPAVGRAEHFIVSIEQGGRSVPIVAHKAHLRREPFTVVLSFPSAGQKLGVMVNASRDGKLAAAVRAGSSASVVLPLPLRALPEPLRNPHQRIFVNDKSYNYWYYNNEQTHRFDAVQQVGDRYLCRRQIACFATDMEAANVSVDKFDADVLYLTFVRQILANRRRNELCADYLELHFD